MDEKLIIRKLMFDGDGTGEDRQLNNLVKTVTKLGNTQSSEKETMQELFQKALFIIKECELNKQRSQLVRRRVIEEINLASDYSRTLIQLRQEIKDDINKSKIMLNLALSIKQSRMHFDLLAKKIKCYKTHGEYMSEIEKLNFEIDELKTQFNSMGERLKIFENHCKSASFCVNSIVNMLEDDCELS